MDGMVPDSPVQPDTLVPEMRIRELPSAAWWPTVVWRLFQLFTLTTVALAGQRLLFSDAYRIDVDVYRMGGQAWLDGSSLYSDGVLFTTVAGLGLPFTYPPLAAVVFAPFAWLSLDAASTTITVVTFALLVVSMLIVLTRLDVWQHSNAASGAPWRRRCWLAVAAVAVGAMALEPIQANFDFGQINVVLMTLVIADCVPRKTPWPRGLLIGVAIALKLTPAVFLLYLLMRRDTRALLTSIASAVVATAVGFALAWRDSVQYWTETVRDTDRIGTITYHTNQNIAGALARLGLGESLRFGLWVVACFAVLALTVWAVRRVLLEEQPVLALVCVAMFGLVVSPVSWSHHWVWALPAVVVTGVLAYRYRNVALGVISAIGVILMVTAPINLMPKHQETSAALWRQLIGDSYVWWALALIAVAGAVTLRQAADRRELRESVDAATPAHAVR